MRNLINNKYVRKLLNQVIRNNRVWSERFLIITNNFCDQACFSCSTKCDTEIGSNPFRWEKHITPISDIERLLTLVDGYLPDYWVRLSGGESTLCGPDYLKKICDLSRKHGRKISLLTNGARLLECDPYWFDFITLDEHIVNADLIKKIRRYFKKVGYKRYQVLVIKEHRDLEYQRTGNITDGLKCSAIMKGISLWRNTVYPCCILPFLDGWNNNTLIRESQNASGWTLDNPDLVETMKKWVKTLGNPTIHACKTQCWGGGKNIRLQPVS